MVNTTSNNRRNRAAAQATWKPLTVGTVKINADGSLQRGGSTRGIGVVIRDDARLLMVACSKSTRSFLSSRAEELIVAREGLVFAYELVFESCFILEMNAKLNGGGKHFAD